MSRGDLRQMKVASMIKAGCLKSIATIAVDVQYGTENGVWRMVEELVPIIERGIDLRDVKTHTEFYHKTGINDHVSFSWIKSAITIALKVVEGRKTK